MSDEDTSVNMGKRLIDLFCRKVMLVCYGDDVLHAHIFPRVPPSMQITAQRQTIAILFELNFA